MLQGMLEHCQNEHSDVVVRKFPRYEHQIVRVRLQDANRVLCAIGTTFVVFVGTLLSDLGQQLIHPSHLGLCLTLRIDSPLGRHEKPCDHRSGSCR